MKTKTNEAGRSEPILDNIGLSNEYRLSESGEEYEYGKDPEALGENGVNRRNDSVWQQSNDSEEVYTRMASDKSGSQIRLEERSGFIDWGGRIQSNSSDYARETKRVNGLLREISKKDIADTESEDFINEQSGSSILSGGSGRAIDESTGEQTKRVSSYKQKLDGKAKAERSAATK